jgi:hypothetical protein
MHNDTPAWLSRVKKKPQKSNNQKSSPQMRALMNLYLLKILLALMKQRFILIHWMELTVFSEAKLTASLY